MLGGHSDFLFIAFFHVLKHVKVNKYCYDEASFYILSSFTDMTTKRFQITFRINITWTEAYRYKNSTEYVTLQTNLKNQVCIITI